MTTISLLVIYRFWMLYIVRSKRYIDKLNKENLFLRKMLTVTVNRLTEIVELDEEIDKGDK